MPQSFNRNCTVRSPTPLASAAAALTPLFDHADLDGNLLVANDPWEGVLVKEGRLLLPDRPGLGVDIADGLEERFPYIEGAYAINIDR